MGTNGSAVNARTLNVLSDAFDQVDHIGGVKDDTSDWTEVGRLIMTDHRRFN